MQVSYIVFPLTITIAFKWQNNIKKKKKHQQQKTERCKYLYFIDSLRYTIFILDK